jgi:hypothetical protein
VTIRCRPQEVIDPYHGDFGNRLEISVVETIRARDIIVESAASLAFDSFWVASPNSFQIDSAQGEKWFRSSLS